MIIIIIICMTYLPNSFIAMYIHTCVYTYTRIQRKRHNCVLFVDKNIYMRECCKQKQLIHSFLIMIQSLFHHSLNQTCVFPRFHLLSETRKIIHTNHLKIGLIQNLISYYIFFLSYVIFFFFCQSYNTLIVEAEERMCVYEHIFLGNVPSATKRYMYSHHNAQSVVAEKKICMNSCFVEYK